ncbi:hypothetical protein CFC21_065804 [Triticum aestivum]|uniref:Uncharacterized protein n=2 Tax=Triticum aestivum TaxID=4565 RepID=A0A9R1H3Q9_WHEAT|nr:hypothetical protein CFC21_065804 [Triticum aestivum]
MEGRRRGGDHVARRRPASTDDIPEISPLGLPPQVAASREPDPMSGCTRIIGPDHMTDALQLVPPSFGPCAAAPSQAVCSWFPTFIGAHGHRLLRDLRDFVSGLGLRPVSPGAGGSPPFAFAWGLVKHIQPRTRARVRVQPRSGSIDPCDFGQSSSGRASNFVKFDQLY